MNYFIKKDNSKMIEPEEVFLDEVSKDKLNDSRLELLLKNKSFIILYAFIIIVFLVFISRSFQLQVLKGGEFKDLAKNNKTRSSLVLAKRGVIYDRNLNQMVFNVPSFDVVVIPSNLPKDKVERENIILKLKDKLSLEKENVIYKFVDKKSYSSLPVLVKSNISRDDAIFIESNIENLQGIELNKNSIREYKDKEVSSHILGYTGRVSEKDIKQNVNISPIESIGKTGVEYYYDKLLRGENGRIMKYVDSISNLKKERKVKNDIPGNNLILSIDSKLQNAIYKELEKEVTKNKDAVGAAAIATNPKTGEILALVNYPSFNNNIFSKGLSKEYGNILNNKSKPLFNRAISGVYPPGSAIKPFIASAALEDKIITENTKIKDIGYISIKNIYNPDIVYTFRDWKKDGHGIVDVKKALAVSSNVFFYTIGGGYKDIKGLGIEKIKEYLNKFGFGSTLGIDIPGEAEGLIPDKKWKKEVKGESWYIGDTYISSIGQGNVLVTPLQINIATVAVANGGKLLKPYVLKEVLDKDGKLIEKTKPKILNNDFIKPNNLKIVREGMRKSVLEGSGIRLKNFPIEIAGKTGTAQIGNNMTHAWFTSFAPYNNPNIVLTVLIEKGGEGSASAIPVAKEIYKYYFSVDIEDKM